MELEVLNMPGSLQVRLKARQMEQGRRYRMEQEQHYRMALEQRYRMGREQRWQREQERHCQMALERRFLEESCRLVAFPMELCRMWSCCCYHQHRSRLHSVHNSP